MKKILLLLVTLLTSSGSLCAQKHSILWKIDFDMSIDKVMSTIRNLHHLEPTYDAMMSTIGVSKIYYIDVEFEGELASAISFEFVDNKLSSVMVTISPQSTEYVIPTFNKIVKNIVSINKKPNVYKTQFLPPFRKGDGREIEAIQDGKINFMAQWRHPSTNYLNGNTIGLFISRTGDINIVYKRAVMQKRPSKTSNKKR